MTQPTYVDRDGFSYDAVIDDPHPDDPALISEADIHPSQRED
jgi:hypothetical protein